MNLDVGDLNLCIVACTNLDAKDFGGTSDPYVKFGWVDSGDEKLPKAAVKTKTYKKTLNPVFKFDYHWRTPLPTGSSLKLEVWDWDLIGSDNFIGQVLMDPKTFNSEDNMSKSQHFNKELLSKKGKAAGKIEFTMTYTTDAWRQQKKKEADEKEKEITTAIVQKANISMGEVTTLYQKFCKVSKNGYVSTPEELTALNKELKLFQILRKVSLWDPNSSPEALSSSTSNDLMAVLDDPGIQQYYADLMFELFDTDKDQKITFEELCIGISIISNAGPKEKADFYFSMVDKDGNGELEYNEVKYIQDLVWRGFVVAFNAGIRLGLKRQFVHLTVSELNELDRDITKCFKKLDVPTLFTNAAFKHADKDSSKSLTKQEYTDYLCDEKAQAAFSAEVSTTYKKLLETGISEATVYLTEAMHRSSFY